MELLLHPNKQDATLISITHVFRNGNWIEEKHFISSSDLYSGLSKIIGTEYIGDRITIELLEEEKIILFKDLQPHSDSACHNTVLTKGVISFKCDMHFHYIYYYVCLCLERFIDDSSEAGQEWTTYVNTSNTHVRQEIAFDFSMRISGKTNYEVSISEIEEMVEKLIYTL